MPNSSVRLVGCDDPGPSDPVRIVNISEIAAGMALENVITVSPSGGDYKTAEDALGAVSAPGPLNRYQIVIGPGAQYFENNPLPLTPYTVITGSSEGTSVLIAANANQPMFTSANFVIIEKVLIADVSGTGWVLDLIDAHFLEFRNVTFRNCTRGIRVNNANATVAIQNTRIFSPAIPATITGVACNAGTIEIDRLRIEPLTNVTTVLDMDGANVAAQIANSTSLQSGVATYLSAKNDAVVKMDTMTLANMTDCIVMESANVRVVASTIVDVGQDALRIENVGAAPVFSGDGMTVDNPGRYSFNVLHPDAVVSGFGTADLAKINVVAGAQVVANIVDLTEDDEGVNILGEAHIGTPESPAELTAGSGDSYTRGMLVWTETPLNVFTDVSAAARSASGSTFTYPGIALNNSIYVCSSLNDGADFLQHFGIKLNCTVAAVLGGGAIVAEYWNGAAWVAIEHMSTLADAPYTQYANDLFLRAQSEQLRYPAAFLAGWTKNDPPGLGTNYYWIRYRISSGITTAPVFQQWKLSPSRFEVNKDGVTEYFGGGRYPRDLLTHIVLTEPVVGSAPGNANVAFASGITLSIVRNQFNNNSVDAFGVTIVVPQGIDTSIPAILEVGWHADTANAGDVELTVDAAQLETGDPWDGTVPTVQTAQVETVGAGTRYISRLTNFDIDISGLVPGETLALKVQRDATVGNDPPDTLAGNIIFGSARARATFWRP